MLCKHQGYPVWLELGVALGLVLIIEGVIPFLSPEKYRNFVKLLAQRKDKDVRIAGFISMVIGAILIYLLK